jgi:hypothetical protein
MEPFFLIKIMTTTPLLIQNIDYIINDEGNLIFTSQYLLKRGHCCTSGCINCPYGFGSDVDPNVPVEFMDTLDDCNLVELNEEDD